MTRGCLPRNSWNLFRIYFKKSLLLREETPISSLQKCDWILNGQIPLMHCNGEQKVARSVTLNLLKMNLTYSSSTWIIAQEEPFSHEIWYFDYISVERALDSLQVKRNRYRT